MNKKVVDIIKEEYLATIKKEAKELAKEKAQARALEYEIKGIKNSIEVSKSLEYKQRLIIQLPRILEYRKEQYI